MNILVTGSNGFIGKNLVDQLGNAEGLSVLRFNRGDGDELLSNLIKESDAIVHLAGANRPINKIDFQKINVELTEKICYFLKLANKKIPILFTSTSHVNLNTDYGRSKTKAEEVLINLNQETDNPVTILRLPGVFGKYCKPNYNSVVATFCHNIANNLAIKLVDSDKSIPLVYVDDVVSEILRFIDKPGIGVSYPNIDPEYRVQIDYLARLIYSFQTSISTLEIPNVGSGFNKALYSTYLSYLRPNQFNYSLPSYKDPRGSFVEIMKNVDNGQLSYLTAKPGVTRGGHYHHTKCEKFIVVQGSAKFQFIHTNTLERFEIIVSGDKPQVVQTVPGWAHDITNIGSINLIAIVWANEIFDPNRPDTIKFDL